LATNDKNLRETNNLIIRLAAQSDLESLVSIYNQAIRSKTATGHLEEFKVEDRVKWLQKHDPDNYPVYVAEMKDTGKIVGYCTISAWRPGRPGLSQTAEISFYVDYAHHGLGIGSALITHGINDCHRIGKKNLLAIIQEWNTSSISILEKFGFKKWGYFPEVVNMEGKICGQLIYGMNIK